MTFSESPFRWLARLLLAGLFIIGIVYFLLGGSEVLEQKMNESSLPSWLWLVITCCLYALVLAIPFAPGVELGLLIMAMFGVTGILGAWLSTIVGLCIAFAVGTLMTESSIVASLKANYLNRQVNSKAIAWVKTRLVRHPYLTLALLINLPGNIVLGGGGGIALSAGALGQLRWDRFALTIAAASSIVPLFIIAGLMLNR